MHHARHEPATWLGGTLPQWLTLVATVLAFGWAVFLYRQSVREKRIAASRLVYVMPVGQPEAFDVGHELLLDPPPQQRVAGESGPVRFRVPPITPHSGLRIRKFDNQVVAVATEPGVFQRVAVTNGSEEVVTSVAVEVRLSMPKGGSPGHFSVVSYLAPGATFYAEIRWTTPEFRSNPWPAPPAVSFRDGSGRHWLHRAGHPVEESDEFDRWVVTDVKNAWKWIKHRAYKIKAYFRREIC